MVFNFNFTSSGTLSQNFIFGSTGGSPYFNFNFSSPGYYPNSYDFNFGENRIFNILKGESNNFTSIWVMNDKLYVGSNNALNIVNLKDNTLYDFYSKSISGRTEDVLINEDINDIAVV